MNIPLLSENGRAIDATRNHSLLFQRARAVLKKRGYETDNTLPANEAPVQLYPHTRKDKQLTFPSGSSYNVDDLVEILTLTRGLNRDYLRPYENQPLWTTDAGKASIFNHHALDPAILAEFRCVEASIVVPPSDDFELMYTTGLLRMNHRYHENALPLSEQLLDQHNWRGHLEKFDADKPTYSAEGIRLIAIATKAAPPNGLDRKLLYRAISDGHDGSKRFLWSRITIGELSAVDSRVILTPDTLTVCRCTRTDEQKTFDGKILRFLESRGAAATHAEICAKLDTLISQFNKDATTTFNPLFEQKN